MVFSEIGEAVKDIKEGRFIIIVDDENRENEGDLVIAAEKADADQINFMIKYGRGLVCMPIIGSRLDELKIPLMTKENTESTKCQFTVSVDSKNTSTGISAFDRALTVKAILDDNTEPGDLLRPGHMFPLRYKENGLSARAGHTEAAVDIVKLAELYPAAVICEIINDNGKMARLEDLEKFAEKFELKIITIKDLIRHKTE
ncbi:3,4-dihydroxy-2-butanone-4-phosphate synthase [Candidatus Woesearchaeota archaeon]|nr:3,4-dihydroxy-2-butanone-4-phosphate synthase [Candidatus Woesearchaeota archaeon]